MSSMSFEKLHLSQAETNLQYQDTILLDYSDQWLEGDKTPAAC